MMLWFLVLVGVVVALDLAVECMGWLRGEE